MVPWVRLLGPPRIDVAGENIHPPAGKTALLLYYLAHQNNWVSRDTLTYFFWPESSEGAAKKNLRQLLTTVRQFPYTQDLEVQHTQIRWLVETDLKQFDLAIVGHNWATAAQLYQGELLDTYPVEAFPEFAAWLDEERISVAMRWRNAALKFVTELEHEGRHTQAADLLMRLQKIDPLDESLLQRALCNYSVSGQTNEALENFAIFERTLKQEFGGEPDAETLLLIKRIRQGEVVRAESETKPSGVASQSQSPVSHNLPPQPTPFIGRQTQKEILAEKLTDPTCRLLSLVGPGGIGKTRLAIEVASVHVKRFKDGAWFVPLAPLSSADLIVSAVADALRFSFYGPTDPKLQLLDYLRNKELLLVIDNFEHVLSGTGLVADILQAAPRVKVLATSRERLNLQAEWVIHVAGLSYPKLGVGSEIEKSDAVQLFLQNAKRVDGTFCPSEASLLVIAHICTLVEGMPLAIELSAAWLDTLSPFEIAEEIEHGIALLTSTKRDVPERHRSVHAVLDYSWRLLTEDEKSALRSLSVFTGGFTRESATEVAGISVPTLQALIHKSILYRGKGRYERHPLVWQYTKEQANAFPEAMIAARNRHASFYGKFMLEQEKTIKGGRQKQAVKDIEAELENIRAAWLWAAKQRELSTLEQFIECLFLFYSDLSSKQQGEWFFKAAVDELGEEKNATVAKLLMRQGWFAAALGNAEHALELCERGLVMAKDSNLSADAQAFNVLGHIHLVLGHWSHAEESFRQALEIQDPAMVGPVTNNLGLVKYLQQDYTEAERYYREVVTILNQPETKVFKSVPLANLGNVYKKLGKLKAAREAYEESLQIAQEANDKPGTTDILVYLGALCYLEEKYEQAESYFLQSLPELREHGVITPPHRQETHGAHLTHSLNGLGETTASLGRHTESLAYFREALSVALKFSAHSLGRSSALESIVGAAAALTDLGKADQALQLVCFALVQVDIKPETKVQAKRLYIRLNEELPCRSLETVKAKAVKLRFDESLSKLVTLSSKESVFEGPS